MNESVSNTPKIIGVSIGIIVLLGLAILYFANASKQDSGVATTPSSSTYSTSTTAAQSPSSSTASSSTTYKDGTYRASASYSVPHDMNTINVTLTVKNGSITAVQTDNSYGDHESARYVNGFDSQISNVVVGKKLSDAQVYGVSGASDTSTGFNEALQTIMQQAQS